jgi:hypothetical protein
LIIAIKEKDRVVVGQTICDTNLKLNEADCANEENVPLKFNSQGTLFACFAVGRRSDVLLYDDDFLEMEITPKTIVKEIIPLIKKKMSDSVKPLDNGKWKNCLIICDNEHIFDIDNNLYFSEITDYVCHGCSTDEVISVLDLTTSEQAEDRIIKAVSFAGKVCNENLFPIVIADTKTKTFKCVYKGE